MILGSGAGAWIRDCTMRNLRLVCRPGSDTCHSFFYAGSYAIDGCSFENCSIAVPEEPFSAGKYGLSIVGNGSQNIHYSVVNSTFVSNRFEYPAQDGVEVTAATVLSGATSSGVLPQGGVANCTFLSDGAEAEIGQFGDFHSRTFAIVGSVFSGPDEGYYPFDFTNPGLVSIIDCSIDPFAQIPGGLAAINGAERDRVPFARFADAKGKPMLRPIVRMPGLRDSPDVSTNSAATYLDVRQSYRYRMPGTTTWVALTPVFAGASLAAYRPLDDAAGVERVYGAFTRGAVQSITEGVAGHTVVVRMDPLGAGTITAAGLADARAYAQTVPVGATPAALTATGLNGATFLGWFNTNGVEVATTATYAPPAPAADTVLVAKFEPAKVAVTFALVGGDGRFAGNGEASITLPCGIGTAFPSVPAFTYSTAAYVFEGWGHDFPVYVPACATAFTGTLYQTAPRIVRVVPPSDFPAGSDGSGDSWANAMTNFHTACKAAGRYRGEVWMKTGRYLVGDASLYANVAVRGGFAGTETETSEADPVANPTVVTGDVQGNDYWIPSPTTPSIGTPAVWAGLAFTMPNPGRTHTYWKPSGNNADDIEYFSVAADAVTNALFDGLTFTCYKNGCLRPLGASTDIEFSRCRFLANHTACTTLNSASLDTYGRLVIRGCDFIGSAGSLYFRSSSYFFTNVIEECLFRDLFDTTTGPQTARPVVMCNVSNHRLDMRRCTFLRNYVWSNYGYHSGIVDFSGTGGGTVEECLIAENTLTSDTRGIIRVGHSNGGTAGSAEIIRCVFRDNTAEGASGCGFCITLPAGGSSAVVRDCLFTNNVNVAPKGSSANLVAHLYAYRANLQVVNSSFVDNTVDGPDTSTSGAGFSMVGGYDYAKVSVVHCALRGNSYGAIGTAATKAAIMTYGTSSLASGAASAISTVFDDGVAALRLHASTPVQIAASAIGDVASTYTPGISTNVWTCPARLARNLAEKAGVPPHLRLAGTSPFVRAGVPVWRAPAGAFYWYDPYTDPAKPWRSTLTPGTAAASVAGLTLASDLIPDAFGQPRVLGKVAIGPVNTPPAGTLMYVR